MAESDHSSTPSKSPAFQFYARDFSEGTRALSAEEVGSYIRLLCHQWDKGSLPSGCEPLARIAGVSLVRMRRVWCALEEYFIVDPTNPNRLVNARLEKERQKQLDYRRHQSDKGRASAANRKATEPQPSLNRASTEPQPSGQPKGNSSVFSLQSSDFRQQTQERARELLEAERAGEFIERYKALHLRLRKGAHYLGKIHFDFQEALQLVAVYDDARLDKLAYVWLNTDHDFAQNGTRTIAKFRSMCSWCEERLIEWEAQHGPLSVAS